MAHAGLPDQYAYRRPDLDAYAVSVPAGFTPDGLPVGLEIVGLPYREADSFLSLAYAYEQLTPGIADHLFQPRSRVTMVGD